MKRFFHLLSFAFMVLVGIFFFWMTALDWVFKEPAHMWRDLVLAVISLLIAGDDLVSACSREKGGAR